MKKLAFILLPLLASAQTPSRERQFKDTVYFPPNANLTWPLASGDQKYAAIDGNHLLTYVKELTDIAEHDRATGRQYWGRITGSPSDPITAQWMLDKLKSYGFETHQENLDLPPQWVPASWEAIAVATGQQINLSTATPMVRTPGTDGKSLDLEAIYVGLGTAADFMGRDVKGKAVFFNAEALPGAWQQSGTAYGALQRAEAKGAAAVFMIIDLPGNFRTEIAAGTKIPTFTLGYQDGAQVRGLIEKDLSPHIKVKSDINPQQTGEKTSIVWGILPGQTDEKIIINAHRDGYYEAADDNATGMATAIGLAEYYSKLPKDQRRRTIVVVGNSGHHNTAVSSQWLVAHKDTFFAKAALIINCEHSGQTMVDLYGYKLLATNMPGNFDWYVHGSPKFKEVVTNDWDRFGVSRYVEPTERANGDMGSFSGFGPSFQLIAATQFYHSDHDTYQTIPPSGLASVTRSYAKIIDDVNKLTLAELE